MSTRQKTLVLAIVAGMLLTGTAQVQSVTVANHSFEQPYTVKKYNWQDVPGWSSDTVATSSGVEKNGYVGAWNGYLMAGTCPAHPVADPAVWQLTDHTIASGEVLTLMVVARIGWMEGTTGDLGKSATYRMALYYDDNGTRVVAKTQDVVITATIDTGHDALRSNWAEYTLIFDVDTDCPVAVGNNIGIELFGVSHEGTGGCWLGMDHVRLSTGIDEGSVYYVDATGGDDNNDGRSDATAWRTIEKVNNYTFQTGDDVYLKCGEIWTPSDYLRVDWQTSTTSENHRAVIGAYFMDGDTEVIVDETNYQDHTKPILQGSYDPYTWPNPVGVPTNAYNGLLYAYGGNDYVTFQDIHVKDSNGDGVRYYRCNYGCVRRVRVEVCNKAAIRYVQCHRYTPTGDLGGERLSIIEYCETSGDNQNYRAAGNQAFAMGSVGGSHAWVHHNIMHEGYGEALGVYNNTSLPDQGWATVEDNIIYDMRKAGIYIASGRDTIVRRNLIYHTGNSTYYLAYANGRYWGGPGLGVCNEIGDGQNYQSNNVYFYDNLVIGCHSGLGISSQWPIGEDAISNIKYFNNTLVANKTNTTIGREARAAIEAGFGNEIKNNIFWLYDASVEEYQFRGYAPYSGITWDYNLWSSDPDTGCPDSWGCGRVKGPDDPYYALPQLKRISGWHNIAVGEITPDDFTLQCCSPAIEAGTDVGLTHDFEWNTVPHGFAPDIGAFEFTGIAHLPIAQTGWSLEYVDSEETVGEDGAAINSFDGDSDTFWGTKWHDIDPDPDHPHEIQIDLGGFYDICGFRYLPRQDGSENGMIDEYEFYVSNDSDDWETAVAGGTLAKDKTEKQVTFDCKLGKYVRLVAFSEVNGNEWTTMAELNVLAVQPDTDINDDGKVNIEDFAILATWWDDENACSPPDWCGGADFDMSGTVDFFDLAYFVENWLRQAW